MAAIDQITQLYVGYYDRAPDPDGLNYWVGRFNLGMSLLDIAQSFSVQAETRALYSFLGATPVGTADNFLESVYRNLFNRAIDAEGLSYWKGELAAGKPVGRAIVDIISGAQATDKVIVDNKTLAGLFYNSEVSSTLSSGFRLADARQVLDGVDATAASVASARALATSLATEDLTLIFNDPTGTLAPLQAAISKSLHIAWDLWSVHFTRHAPIEIEVNYEPGGAASLAVAHSFFYSTDETFGGRPIGQAAVTREIVTGIDPNGREPDGEISIGVNLPGFVFRSSLSESVPFQKFDAISIFAHEIGHLLGFSASFSSSSTLITSFERYVSGTTNPVFNGPAAKAANGGVGVRLAPGSPSHLADTTDLMATALTNGQVREVELLHLAILQDTGLPVSLLGIGGLV